jgi:hypothetical protein
VVNEALSGHLPTDASIIDASEGMDDAVRYKAVDCAGGAG